MSFFAGLLVARERSNMDRRRWNLRARRPLNEASPSDRVFSHHIEELGVHR